MRRRWLELLLIVAGVAAWFGTQPGNPSPPAAPVPVRCQSFPTPASQAVVEVRFGDGWSGIVSWGALLYPDGSVWRLTLSGRLEPGNSLTSSDLRNLLAVFKQQGFLELSSNLKTTGPTDCPGLSLTLRQGGHTHAVVVIDPAPTKDPRIARFLTVWAAVLRVCPSRHAGDTPEYWLSLIQR